MLENFFPLPLSTHLPPMYSPLGENPKFVFLTGSPSIDELRNNKITGEKQFESKYGFKLTKKLDNGPIYLKKNFLLTGSGDDIFNRIYYLIFNMMYKLEKKFIEDLLIHGNIIKKNY